MTGRTRQKERTRAAIVDAALALADRGDEVTMPAVAATAGVSEATAYRYFPDLVSLLAEIVRHVDPVEALAPVADSTDPVERVGRAAEVLARHVLARQGAVRAMIAGTVARPVDTAAARPAQRLALVEAALAPWVPDTSEDRERLLRDLSVVVSAEAVFTLVDLCGLGTEAAVASLADTARTVTAARTDAHRAPPGDDTG